jgi:hypothetical protein
MIVDRIIFENVTVEQLLFLEAREHVVGLYHVLVPVNFFTLFPSRVFLVMERLQSTGEYLRVWEEAFDGAPDGCLPILKSSSPL